MKSLGKILSWLWAISFGAFFVLSFIPGENLPEVAIEYREQFRYFLGAFLKSPWFLVAFLAMWIFVMHILAKKSGWKKLADHYSKNYAPPLTSKFLRGSGYIGNVSYNGVLKVCVDTLGIYLKMMFPFNIGHKPLLIPWHDVEDLTGKEALVPEKTPRFLRKIAEMFSWNEYKRVNLKPHPDQNLVIHWNKRFDQTQSTSNSK